MSGGIAQQKSALRAHVRAELKKISAAGRTAASAQAVALLERQAIWQKAGTVLLYAPLSQELDLWPLAIHARRAGKKIALPRFDPATGDYAARLIEEAARDLGTGRFGIREPKVHCAAVALNRLDLVLVPGLAYDLQGRRLGRGKGYYDRLLAAVRGTTCGVAFDQQILSEIPVEPHDVIVNCILTPTRWIEPKPRVVPE